MLKFKDGDASVPNHFTCIAHVVNNIGVWGGGFTASLEREYPGTGTDYRKQLRGRNLGDIFFTHHNAVAICHMVAQNGVISANNPMPLVYTELDICLGKLADSIARLNITAIQMPMIGSGLAGGDWNVIEPMIAAHFCEIRTPVTIFRYQNVGSVSRR
jgi:O-acetyl-ADP-ribose deacetylase (regulator of RNase III)